VRNKVIHYHHSFPTVLQYTIRKDQENQESVEVNGTNQLWVYADDINLLEKT